MKVADPIIRHTYYIRYLLHPAVIEGVKGKEAICKAKVAGFGLSVTLPAFQRYRLYS